MPGLAGVWLAFCRNGRGFLPMGRRLEAHDSEAGLIAFAQRDGRSKGKNGKDQQRLCQQGQKYAECRSPDPLAMLVKEGRIGSGGRLKQRTSVR